MVGRIRRWRARHPSWGAPKLRWALQRRFGSPGLPSEAAIGRWLKQWGLVRRRRRPVHKGPLIERPRLTMAKSPNEVWTVDFKGWFRTGDGSRVEPMTVRDLASRYILGIILLGRQNISECRQALVKTNHQYDLPQIMWVDNDLPFGSMGAMELTDVITWRGIC